MNDPKNNAGWLAVLGALMALAQLAAKTMLWVLAALIMGRVYQIMTLYLARLGR